MPISFTRPVAPERPMAERPAEIAPERAPEQRPAVAAERPAEGVEPAAPAPPSAGPAPAAVPKGETLVAVETILQDNLAQIYRELPANLQPQFKQRGEEVAGKIELMIRQAKVKAKQVLQLILDWLRLLPGVNRLFLEQEAKIKTDRVVALAKGIEEGREQERRG